MVFRIEELETFKIVGLMSDALRKRMRDRSALWKQIIKEGLNEGLVPLITKKNFSFNWWQCV